MSNSLKERIIKVLIFVIIDTIFLSVISLFILKKENWLLHSFTFAILWGVGMFIGESIAVLQERKVYKIIAIGIIILIVIVFGLFAKYVLYNNIGSIDIFDDVIFPYVFGLVFNFYLASKET